MELFRFANPEYLYYLLALPPIVVLWIISRYRTTRSLAKFGRGDIIKRLIPDRSPGRNAVKFLLVTAAYISVVIAAARPQYGSKLEERALPASEVIIVLDVSKSMLAEDIRPNRLEASKQAIRRLIDQLGDDRVGLILFAGDAFVQLPVTADHVSARMFLSAISTDIMPVPGTAIGRAIDLAARSFSPTEMSSKVVIIISDGETHDDDPIASAKEAADRGIVIHTVGIGSPEGVPIPIGTGADRSFLKDHEGNTVVTRLDEEMLREIASTAGGRYVRASNSGLRLREIYSEVERGEAESDDRRVFTEYYDHYHYLAAFALLLILADSVTMNRKNNRINRIKLFKLKV